MNASLQRFLIDNGWWLALIPAVAGIALLIFLIVGVVRLMRAARLFDVPLVPEQGIVFPHAGRVVLCIEGPLLSNRFRGLHYELGTPDGSVMKGRPALFRAHSSGFTTFRMETRVFGLSTPGSYVFRIEGLKEEPGYYDKHRIVFMRPHLFKAILHVLGMLVAGSMIIGGIVLFGMCLTGVFQQVQ